MRMNEQGADAESRAGLVVVESEPFNAETPLAELAEPLTPTRLFYVRNHFDVPRLSPRSWRLVVEGLVSRRVEVGLDEIQALPRRTLAVTLECAGNGRAFMSPAVPGTAWRHGAVATAEFTGAPLAALLERVQPSPEATEVVFTGADSGRVGEGRLVAFERSLPLVVARHEDILLVWEMNGEPLTPDHGAPVRLIVPGWYGVASVKWLERIELTQEPFRGYYQVEKYVYAEAPERVTTPVTRMLVRSVIARPLEGERLRAGRVEIAGMAWSGAGPVERVDVSTDGGMSWREAELGVGISPYSASPWRLRWDEAQAGPATLLARASDVTGATQPLEPSWNLHGYGNNAVQAVRVTVADE
ncbi:MAG: sulfite oxidase [Gemmatimonadetes bacterium]|nr:sulfite oxidase [Gemmatimonadota bacterium]